MANQSDSSQVVSGTQLRSELTQIAIETIVYGAHTVTFQPRTKWRNEDRHLVEDWKLSNGTWKFIGVFDGHGVGIEAVEFVLETLPGMIKVSLESAVDTPDTNLGPSMRGDFGDIDDRIKAGLVNFFPGGLEQISELSDDEFKPTSIIKDPETEYSYVQILRARTGTTALITLVDPSRSLHVASLGDCEALLGTQNFGK